MTLEKLAPEVLELTVCFLTGHDIFYLSHANSWLLRLLSDDRFWLARLPQLEHFENQKHSGKQRYLTARSLRFVDATPEREIHNNWSVDARRMRGHPFAQPRDVAPPSAWTHLHHLESVSFSFFLWFALLPATTERPPGGILYGMQFTYASRPEWPPYSHHIVLVDRHHNLYCSVLNVDKIIATRLESNRWYHLALTYNTETGCQDVYVDGVNVWSTAGQLHHDWFRLRNEQVGTGCFMPEDRLFPHPMDAGWHPFNGLVDDFCLHGGVWTAAEIAGLASSSIRWAGDDGYMNAALRLAGDSQRADHWANAQLVRCTRPAEGKRLYMEERRLSSE